MPQLEEEGGDIPSIADAIREAMETPQSLPVATIETPGRLPTPEPHLPLRKSSPHKLQAKRAAPTPLRAPAAHQLRGFSPSPVQASPQMDNVSASSEHAFAGREETRRGPFKPPLGVQAMMEAEELRAQYAAEESASSSQVDGVSSRPPSSPLLGPPTIPTFSREKKGLRGSKSVGDGLRGWKHRFSSPNRGKAKVDGEMRSSVPVQPNITSDEVRDSFRSAVTSSRSAVTSSSSFLHTSSTNTAHSSLTATSSHNSDYVKVYPEWPDTHDEADNEDEDEEDDDDDAENEEEDMTVEDAIGMYADGFDSARPSMQSSRPTSQPTDQPQLPRPNLGHRRSQSASLLDRVRQDEQGNLLPPQSSQSNHKHTFSHILAGRPKSMLPTPPSDVPRDRYGFKKASHYITVAQYDAWDAQYSQHLERRRKKWHTLMDSYGLTTTKPYRFPPKSDKIKRYVRKGIPLEFRGPAWFWYAGGPSKMAKEPGLYWEVLEKVGKGQLSDNDREHIERDLNRTFPDNVKFKPDPTTTLDAQAGAGGGDPSTGKRKSNRMSAEPETSMLKSLRRVLQAFAVHNPSIGYCQSLNFIAGLLLLFLDRDEEKAFVLLNIVTNTHLPGTHGVALEGANIDIAVLMSCIKDALPAIWAKLDDKGGSSGLGPTGQALRLPTVSLATTAWFMSLFVGTLPIESVLRVWDCLFFEGSKTLFRIALSIFKTSTPQITAVSDPMEIFQVVQTIPRSMLDINGLMEVCFRRKGGFSHVSQEMIERRRAERRVVVRDGVASVNEERFGWRGRLRAKTNLRL